MDARHLLARGAEWLGVLILIATVVVALPLLAAGLWMMRVVLLAAGVAALVTGCVLYCVYPRFRHWADHWAHPTQGASS